MATLGQTIYERMLAKQQADQAYARDEARFQQQNTQNLWQQGLQEQQLQEQKKQAEFDRQFKVAQALGQSAAYRGEAAPQMRSDVSQEYADIGNAQGGYDFNKFLQEQAQKQRETQAKLGIANLEHIDKVDQRAFERDQKQSLQDDQQDFEWKLQNMLEGGRNFRDKQAADGKAKDFTGSLRNEFQNQQVYKNTQTLAEMYQKLKTSTPGTGPGNMSLIFAYMKMLDPISSVREGEYATARNAGSIPEGIWSLYNKAKDGAFIAPELLQKYQAEADSLMAAQKSRYDAVAGQYRRLAGNVGANPEDVVLDIGLGNLGGRPSAAPVGRLGPPPEIIEGLKRDAAAGDIRAIQALEELKLGR